MSIFFADDSNLFMNGKDFSILETELNKILKNISEWLKVNKLSLNVKKTHVMVFSKKNYSKIPKPEINLKIDGEVLSVVTKTKFLGVIIDDKLTWNDHTNFISGKIGRGIGILLKARHVLNRETLITLYYSFVYPYYMYCNQVWGSCTSRNITRLHVLQKKAIRIICHVKHRSHTEPLFRELKFLNIWQINKYLIGIFMYKHYHKLLPLSFNSFFTRNRDVHSHDTRQASKHYHIPIAHKNYSQSNIHFRGPIIWNDILTNKTCPDITIGTFKRNLKELLIKGVI